MDAPTAVFICWAIVFRPYWPAFWRGRLAYSFCSGRVLSLLSPIPAICCRGRAVALRVEASYVPSLCACAAHLGCTPQGLPSRRRIHRHVCCQLCTFVLPGCQCVVAVLAHDKD